jgi:hypothetical protein
MTLLRGKHETGPCGKCSERGSTSHPYKRSRARSQLESYVLAMCRTHSDGLAKQFFGVALDGWEAEGVGVVKSPSDTLAVPHICLAHEQADRNWSG